MVIYNVLMTITVTAFKAKCLELLRQSEGRAEPIEITRHGKVIARVVPAGVERGTAFRRPAPTAQDRLPEQCAGRGASCRTRHDYGLETGHGGQTRPLARRGFRSQRPHKSDYSAGR